MKGQRILRAGPAAFIHLPDESVLKSDLAFDPAYLRQSWTRLTLVVASVAEDQRFGCLKNY